MIGSSSECVFEGLQNGSDALLASLLLSLLPEFGEELLKAHDFLVVARSDGEVEGILGLYEFSGGGHWLSFVVVCWTDLRLSYVRAP